MKKGWSNELKVGIMVIVFAVAGFFVLYFMGDVKKDNGVKYIIRFKKVGGISQGAAVRYAGVNIGKVKKVVIRKAPMFDWDPKKEEWIPQLGPDGKQIIGDQAFVTIAITHADAFYDDEPRLTDTTYVTVSTSMMNDRWIEIRPQPGKELKPGSVIPGHAPVTIEDFVAKAEDAVEKLDKAAANVNEIIGDPESQKNIKLALENFKDLTKNLKDASNTAKEKIEVIAQKLSDVAEKAKGVMNNANIVMNNVNRQVTLAGRNVRSFTRTLDRMARTNEGDVRSIVKNVLSTSRSLKKSLKTVEDLVTKKEFSEDILVTLRNIRNASEDIEGIAADIRSITSDGQLKHDLKVAVKEARQTTEGANRLIKGVNNFFGIQGGSSKNGKQGRNGASRTAKGDRSKISLKKLVRIYAEGEWDKKTGQFSPNLNMMILPDARGSVKIGVDDLGYNNLFNLQYRMGRGNIKPRVGVVRSQLGLGADVFLGKKKNYGVFVDAYNPRDIQVDVTGRVIGPGDFYIHGGVRDVFDRKNPVFGVGKRF